MAVRSADSGGARGAPAVGTDDATSSDRDCAAGRAGRADRRDGPGGRSSTRLPRRSNVAHVDPFIGTAGTSDTEYGGMIPSAAPLRDDTMVADDP